MKVYSDSCLLWQIRNITLITNKYQVIPTRRNTFVPGRVKKGRAVWFSNGKPRKKVTEEGEKTTNRHSWPLVRRLCKRGTWIWGCHGGRFAPYNFCARCPFVCMNFELARTLKSCFVFLRSDDLKWKVRRPAVNWESIFILTWYVGEIIDFVKSFSLRMFAHYLS